jgi:hypothetical protein
MIKFHTLIYGGKARFALSKMEIEGTPLMLNLAAKIGSFSVS